MELTQFGTWQHLSLGSVTIVHPLLRGGKVGHLNKSHTICYSNTSVIVHESNNIAVFLIRSFSIGKSKFIDLTQEMTTENKKSRPSFKINFGIDCRSI